MAFDWDASKRLSNLEKHGVDFLEARLIFDGRPVIHARSTYPDEERWLTTGVLDERYITVVWTPRNDDIRIISARRARDGEQQRHRSLHGG